MKTIVPMLIGFAISALLPAAALAHEVTYDYDHTQDFSRLRTYALRDSTKTDNPFVDERITSAIAAQLAARGLTMDNTHPDVYVTVRQTFDTHQEYTAYNSGYGPYGLYDGWGWGWGPRWGYYNSVWGLGGYTNVQVENVTVRTLTIELRDAATDKMVWRGAGMRTVHPMSKPAHVTKRINHEVDDILENFPPGAR